MEGRQLSRRIGQPIGEYYRNQVIVGVEGFKVENRVAQFHSLRSQMARYPCSAVKSLNNIGIWSSSAQDRVDHLKDYIQFGSLGRIDAGSTLKKRKTKMNKHKYRKRRKALRKNQNAAKSKH